MYSNICFRETDEPQPLFEQVVVNISANSIPRDVRTTSLLPQPGFASPSYGNSAIIFM